MEPYIGVAVNAGQVLLQDGARYVAEERKRQTLRALAIVAGVLVVAIILRRGR